MELLMLIDTIRKVWDGAGNGGILGEPDVSGKGKYMWHTHTQISGMGSREASLGKWRNIYVHMYVCVYIYIWYACVKLCAYTCIYIYIYIYIWYMCRCLYVYHIYIHSMDICIYIYNIYIHMYMAIIYTKLEVTQ